MPQASRFALRDKRRRARPLWEMEQIGGVAVVGALERVNRARRRSDFDFLIDEWKQWDSAGRDEGRDMPGIKQT
jgi:hypothetical protein